MVAVPYEEIGTSRAVASEPVRCGGFMVQDGNWGVAPSQALGSEGVAACGGFIANVRDWCGALEQAEVTTAKPCARFERLTSTTLPWQHEGAENTYSPTPEENQEELMLQLQPARVSPGVATPLFLDGRSPAREDAPDKEIRRSTCRSDEPSSGHEESGGLHAARKAEAPYYGWNDDTKMYGQQVPATDGQQMNYMYGQQATEHLETPCAQSHTPPVRHNASEDECRTTTNPASCQQLVTPVFLPAPPPPDVSGSRLEGEEVGGTDSERSETQPTKEDRGRSETRDEAEAGLEDRSQSPVSVIPRGRAKRPVAREADQSRMKAQEARWKLQRKILELKYELELLSGELNLSAREDLLYRMHCLENGLEAPSGKQPTSLSKMQVPLGTSPSIVLPASRDAWEQRLKEADYRSRRLTQLSNRSDQALRELYDNAQREQLNAGDPLTWCEDQSVPVTNPHCSRKSLRPLETMVPSDVEVDRGAVYLCTDSKALSMLAQTESEPDDRAVVQMFSVPAAGPRRRCQSLSTTLRLGGVGSHDRMVSIIVDCGAAESGYDSTAFRTDHPELVSQIQPVSDRRFVDAQGNEIPLEGVVRMKVCLKRYCFWTDVYIFHRLGVPCLLGVNSQVDGNLVIHPAGGTLIPLGDPTQAVSVDGGGSSAMVSCGESCAAKCCAADTTDPGHGVSRLSVVRSHEGQRVEFVCGKDRETVECCLVDTQPALADRMNEAGNRIVMRLMHDVIVPARKGSRPGRASLKLEYQEWVQGEDLGVWIEPSSRVAQAGLEGIATCCSTFDAHGIMQVLNHGDAAVQLKLGDDVAYGAPGSSRQSAAGTHFDKEEEEPSKLMIVAELESYEELARKSFAEGGPPVSATDWEKFGLDLSKSINPGVQSEDGSYAPLAEYWKDRIREIASRWWLAWSRDDKAPRISRLVVIEIPTGDAKPVATKPYPIPFKYKAAVVKEMQKLLDAGLIEPGISDWASPTLLTVKKDSTTEELKVKIVCDFRKLNEVTVPDTGGLGNQEEILASFGGGQKYAGIMDIAGGFYQFALSERDRHKSAFVLPTSMGGTSFIWRVAPYGLCRNPASYSRGMMFALQGLHDVSLAPLGQSRGGTHSWIDDVTCHADSMEGFLDQFERILQRLCHCGLTLKASKAHLLHEHLEVLGYYVTPDGLKMQEKKIEAIKRIPSPSSIEEARVYLGAVNFYRRFIPKIGMLARPITDMLRKNGVWNQGAVDIAVKAINSFLTSDAVMGFPDFVDPLAEFVLCPDACNVAVGGVLLQWQHPGGAGPGPPSGTPMRGERGRDPITQSWREKAGWKLVTLAYYSKSLDSAQRNYNVFDKEAGAILMCLRHWSDIVTACPTTVYTDSSVAASMLTKYQGTTRLQRWGMELMQYLPYLKISYRKGEDNGMADLLSRFPLFKKYVPDSQHVVSLPDDLWEKIGEAVQSQPARVNLSMNVRAQGVAVSLRIRTDYFELYDGRRPALPEEIWQEDVRELSAEEGAMLDRTRIAVELSDSPMLMAKRLECFADTLEHAPFYQDQRKFETHMDTLEKYSQTFVQTLGDGPVVYDLYCGEGGYSRGARAMGATCYGFDSDAGMRHAYEHDPTLVHGQRSYADSGMQFTQRDVDSPAFWNELMRRGRIGNLPPPDIIHASPPCGVHSKIGRLNPTRSTNVLDLSRVNRLIQRLKLFEASRALPLLWQVENVPEASDQVSEQVSTVVLCGAMMGHRVFRHRLFMCNYAAVCDLAHDHRGKRVGVRGLIPSSKDRTSERPNMYGVYSTRNAARGSLDEWHGALGASPGTYTRTGIAGVLPLGYGRYMTAQMIMWALHRRFGTPVWHEDSIQDHERAALASWAREGYPHGKEVSLPVRTPLPPSVNSQVCAMEGVAVPEPLSAADLTAPREPLPAGRPDGSSVFHVDPQDQQSDPACAYLLRQLEKTGSAVSCSGNWLVADNGLLYRRGVDSLGEIANRLYLPQSLQYEVMHHSHFSLNPGHRSRALYSSLRRLYYWETMKGDCDKFVLACKTCQARLATKGRRVDPGFAPTPALPFEVIHVDFKGPMKGSPDFSYILVVVCALTRYVLYIPTADRKASTVFRALVNNVFSVFGPPKSVVSDNGSEFAGDLAEEMAQFLGYRKVNVLPWRPQANGLAEAAVKRIKQLLVRHTRRYQDWVKILPLAQYALNSSTHEGLDGGVGLSAYSCLFGREPPSIAELENLDLRPRDGDGSEFVNSLRDRMRTLHAQVREKSDSIKRQRQLSNTASPEIKAEPPIVCGDLVWLRYGSKERSRRIDKDGDPFKHPYLVLELSPFGARLQPTEGARRTLDWQPLHNLSRSPAQFHDDTPLYDADSHGLVFAPDVARQRSYVRVDPVSLEEDAPPPNDDGTYDIDGILSARKIKNRWHVMVKWRGYAIPTEESRVHMYENCTDPEVLAQIDQCVMRARGLDQDMPAPEYDTLADDSDSGDELDAGNDAGEFTQVLVLQTQSSLAPQQRIHAIQYLRAYRSLNPW